jgi:hypothetical protein
LAAFGCVAGMVQRAHSAPCCVPVISGSVDGTDPAGAGRQRPRRSARAPPTGAVASPVVSPLNPSS